MRSEIRIVKIALPPVDKRVALRYAFAPHADEQTSALMDECISDISPIVKDSVLYATYPLKIDGDDLDLGFTRVTSASLSRHLSGCSEVVVMLATAGVGVDGYVARYQRVRPSRAYLASAVGTERVEALADAFSAELARMLSSSGKKTTSRFSPGYGDLTLECQRDIVESLMAYKYAGVTLNESLMLVPVKTVTAFIGVKDE